MQMLIPGLLLLLVPQQELEEKPLHFEDYAFEIRIPKGWYQLRVKPPAVARYIGRKEEGVQPNLTLIYYEPTAPTTMQQYKDELNKYLAKHWKHHKPLSERSLKIDGIEAYQKRIEMKSSDGIEMILIKTVLRRSPTTFYLLDSSFPKVDKEKFGDVAAKSIETFKYRQRDLNVDESKGEAEFVAWMKSRKSLGDKVTGESWQTIKMGGQKLGWRMQSLSKKDGEYVFTTEMKIESEDGASNSIQTNGSFTPDGRSQRISYEQSNVNDEGKKSVYKADVKLVDGKVTATRTIGGKEETREFTVPAGTLLDDVAQFFRRALLSKSGQKHLMRVLGTFRDVSFPEFLEIAEPEEIKWKGEKRKVTIVTAESRGGRIVTFWYDADTSALLNVVSPKSPLSIHDSTKDEATGGK